MLKGQFPSFGVNSPCLKRVGGDFGAICGVKIGDGEETVKAGGREEVFVIRLRKRQSLSSLGRAKRLTDRIASAAAAPVGVVAFPYIPLSKTSLNFSILVPYVTL